MPKTKKSSKFSINKIVPQQLPVSKRILKVAKIYNSSQRIKILPIPNYYKENIED